MKPLLSLFFAVGVLFAAAGPSAAADCKVVGWTDGYGAHPIFQCPDDQPR